jgi:hypothetical protein
LRHFLTSTVPSHAQIGREAGGWSVSVPERLLDVPNHRDNRALVRLINLSDDEQLRDWLVGAAQAVKE